MSRLGQTAGSLFDEVMAWMDRRAPDAAFEFKRHVHRPDAELSLRRLARAGFSPAVAIDAGACLGDWAQLCRKVFPSCRVLMIEPSPERVRVLQGLCHRDLQLRVEQALLGSRDQEVFFREDGPDSRVVAQGDAGAVRMASSPLDMLVPGSPFAAPELLKIGVQGYELEVLEGARETLPSVQVLLVELSLLADNAHTPSVRQAVDWLDDHGFRLLDICSVRRRPADDAVVQLDAVFVRKNVDLAGMRRDRA